MSARSAGESSRITGNGSTAPWDAMPKPGGRTMDNYNERITAYRLAMNMASAMRKRGIISDKDYEKIRTVIAEKYGISLSGIFVDNI